MNILYKFLGRFLGRFLSKNEDIEDIEQIIYNNKIFNIQRTLNNIILINYENINNIDINNIIPIPHTLVNLKCLYVSRIEKLRRSIILLLVGNILNKDIIRTMFEKYLRDSIF